jgi:nitrite reductase/ring-hydroxylating ferredoxin subunit
MRSILKWSNCGLETLVIGIILHGGILSSRAFLVSVPQSLAPSPLTTTTTITCNTCIVNSRKTCAASLWAKNENDKVEQSSEQEGGFFRFFSKDKNNDSEEKPVTEKAEDAPSPGFFQFLSKGKETKKEKDVNATMPKELGNDNNFLAKAFNAFESAEKRLPKIRTGKETVQPADIQPKSPEEKRLEERRNAAEANQLKRLDLAKAFKGFESSTEKRSDKVGKEMARPAVDPRPQSQQEKRLEEIRKITEANRLKKLERVQAQKLSDQRSMDIRAQRLKERDELEAKAKERRVQEQSLSDQRSVDGRTQKLKERAELEAKAKERREKRKSVLEAAQSGSAQTNNGSEISEETKRINPLTTAQKMFSNVWAGKKSQEEQWIVVAPKWMISPGELVPITAAGLDLLLVASKDGSALHCIANSCPHLGTPLELAALDRRPVETPPDSTTTAASPIALGDPKPLQETDIAKMLTQDGCEDCIVCPLHRTAFALASGEVRGEWCPYPPVIGKLMGTVKTKTPLPVFDVRTRGKNIEVRLNTRIS